MLFAAETNYPLLQVFLSMLYFFLFVIWIWIAIMVIFDIFRSRDLSGWGKALWFLFVLLLPYLGVFIYLIARGGKMHERRPTPRPPSRRRSTTTCARPQAPATSPRS